LVAHLRQDKSRIPACYSSKEEQLLFEQKVNDFFSNQKKESMQVNPIRSITTNQQALLQLQKKPKTMEPTCFEVVQ